MHPFVGGEAGRGFPCFEEEGDASVREGAGGGGRYAGFSRKGV